MAEIIAVPQEEAKARLRRLALEGISSSSTRRAYSAAMDEFLTWAQHQSPPGFSKVLVQQYKSMLLEKQLAPSTINQRLAAVRRLAFEGADNGLLDPSIAAAIGRVQGVRSCGLRLGHWLGREDIERLLQVPGGASVRALRDGAILALLFGGGLRRSEVAALAIEQFRIVEERWVIVDLNGKHGRIRSVPIPSWTKGAVDLWTCVRVRLISWIFFRTSGWPKIFGGLKPVMEANSSIRYDILLYTGSPDSEGTLGGLVEIGRKNDQHLRNAIELGRLCSNDPVCAQHSAKQLPEERFLLGAACHGCLLISETSCAGRETLASTGHCSGHFRDLTFEPAAAVGTAAQSA